MIRRLLSWTFFGWFLITPAIALAGKTTYVFSDRRFNFIKRVELKKKELKERGELNQPYTFIPLQVRKMLEPIKLNRTYWMSKKETEQEVFDKEALDFLVPHLVQAFKDAKSNEEVIFSYLTRSKKFLTRDDRITIVHSWIVGDQWHLAFNKLMAKIPNTYDLRADINTAINRAQGLRVSLELAEGQQYGATTDALLLKIPAVEMGGKEETESKQPEEESVLEEIEETTEVVEKKEERKSEAKPAAKPVVTPVSAEPKKEVPQEVKAAPVADERVEERLKKLQELKKQKLIDKKEYEEKKKEILKDL